MHAFAIPPESCALFILLEINSVAVDMSVLSLPDGRLDPISPLDFARNYGIQRVGVNWRCSYHRNKRYQLQTGTIRRTSSAFAHQSSRTKPSTADPHRSLAR